MTMDISSDQPGVSICCNLDEVDHPESRCYRNVSILSSTILPTFDNYTWLWSYFQRGPCPDNHICYTDFNSTENNSMYFLKDGAISMYESIGEGYSCRIKGRDYCFEYDSNGTATETVMGDCMLLAALEASGSAAISQADAVVSVVIILLSISLPFFVLTFLVYTIVPELNNLHGIILRSYMSSCFITDICAIAICINRDLVCCSFVAITTHYAFLASWFWMNVMCFDIWWTFRSMRIRKMQSTRKKSIIYSIYAWGTSLLIIVVGFIIEFIPDLPEGVIKPGFSSGCWLSKNVAGTVYMDIPLYLTLSSNICFFVLVVIEITRQKSNTAHHLEGGDSGRHNYEKHRFYLYLKLCVLMGIAWFSAVLPDYVAMILGLPNMLQGLILFILFVCNDRTRRLLSSRVGWKDWKITRWIELTATRSSLSSTERRRQM